MTKRIWAGLLALGMALTALPEQKLLADQCALLLFSYEAQTHRLIAKPMSLISAEHIVRLLY